MQKESFRFKTYAQMEKICQRILAKRRSRRKPRQSEARYLPTPLVTIIQALG